MITLLAKGLAIATVVWLYLTAQERKQPPVKWAIIGLIGYVLAWFIVDKTLIPMFPRSASQSMGPGFMIMQIPAILAFGAVYVIRGILINDAEHAAKNSESKSE